MVTQTCPKSYRRGRMTSTGLANGAVEFNILDLSNWNGAPDEPGAYILLAPRVMFRYPRGESPVFYIGQGKKILSRVKRHHSGREQAKKDRQHFDRSVARHYAAEHGALYISLPARS